MRDILFKGKAHDKWVEGGLIAVPEYDYFCILENEDKIHPMDYPYLDGDFGTFDGKATPVDPETICQFTGLLDKNENKIWEHDICSTDLERPYSIVVFRNGCFMYELNDGDKDYFDIMMPIEPLVDSDKYTEVIGNIFDNPEILSK